MALLWMHSASGESLYVLLGLPKGASDEDIKKAYRRVSVCTLYIYSHVDNATGCGVCVCM